MDTITDMPPVDPPADPPPGLFDPDDVAVDDSRLRLEDAYIGESIADEHLAGKYVYTNVFGWMKFDRRRWKQVPEAIVAEVVRSALIEIHRTEAKNGEDVTRLQQITRLLSASRIKGIFYVARNRMTLETEVFDSQPHLLNVRNGVVDLRDGSLRQHDPELWLTKLAMVDYIPEATHPDWDAALEAFPDTATAEWMQVRFGQGLSGHPVSDDRLVILKGAGSNGKTTIVDAIRHTVGDYAVTVPERVLLGHPGDHPTEMMQLRGARLGLVEEFPELGHLNVKRLKDLHGTGELTARYCGKDSVTWRPTHTMFVTTNYLPRVDESDDGTWRRLALVDFPFRYRESANQLCGSQDRAGDPNLRMRLRDGRGGRHEAVLAWLIAGAVSWYRDNQRMPPEPGAVNGSTQEWRMTADLLMRYVADRIAFDPDSHVISVELYADFVEWLGTNGNRSWSDQTFVSRLAQHSVIEAHGVEKKRISARTGLSRKVSVVSPPLVPPKYVAWLGLRFREDRRGRGGGR